MAKRDNGYYHNFRLSKNNPQHIKIDKLLRDLNPAIVKSKNQYIADAIEYYTNALDNEDLTVSGAMEKAQKAGYITRGDLEIIKREIKDEVMIEVQKEMLSLLGTFTANVATASSPNITQQFVTNNKKKDDFEEVDETLTNLAGKWA